MLFQIEYMDSNMIKWVTIYYELNCHIIFIDAVDISKIAVKIHGVLVVGIFSNSFVKLRFYLSYFFNCSKRNYYSNTYMYQERCIWLTFRVFIAWPCIMLKYSASCLNFKHDTGSWQFIFQVHAVSCLEISKTFWCISKRPCILQI